MAVRVKIGFVVVFVTFFATFFTILFGCYPISKHWQINPNPGSTNCFSLLVPISLMLRFL